MKIGRKIFEHVLTPSVVESGWLQAAYYVAVILCFLAGVGMSGGLVRFGHAPAVALSLSAAALAICAFVTARWGALLLAFTMGAQNAAATRFGDATINTVFITGALLKLFQGVIARLWPANRQERRPALAFLRSFGSNTFLVRCSGR
jgi:uncharacterized membrane protein YoaK (UPF0700 family)